MANDIEFGKLAEFRVTSAPVLIKDFPLV